MQVAHVDLNLIRNAFQFRLILEREAVAAFARDASDDAIAALRDAHRGDRRARRATASTSTLIDDAQSVDRDFHEALIDHLGNDIISKAYRVNWIKVRLIRQNETRARMTSWSMPVMREHLGGHRRDRDARPGRRRRGADAHINNARNRRACADRAASTSGATTHGRRTHDEHHTTHNSPLARPRSRPPRVITPAGAARRRP